MVRRSSAPTLTTGGAGSTQSGQRVDALPRAGGQRITFLVLSLRLDDVIRITRLMSSVMVSPSVSGRRSAFLFTDALRGEGWIWQATVLNLRRTDRSCGLPRHPAWWSCRQGLEKNLYSASQKQRKVKSKLLLGIVVRGCTLILQLITNENKALLVWRDTFFVLTLRPVIDARELASTSSVDSP